METEKIRVSYRKRRRLCMDCKMNRSSCKFIGRMPAEMIREVLLRLPIMDVNRAKCVCKEWQSVISSPKFMEAYSCRRNVPCHGIFIADTDKDAQEFVFYYSPLSQQEEKDEKIHCQKMLEINRLRFFVPRVRVSFSDYQGMTQVVNGLVCLYSSNRLTLLSLCTGETMDLPLPPTPPPNFFCEAVVDYRWDFTHEVCKLNLGRPWPVAAKATNCTAVLYYFGFDTVGKVYKVLSTSYMCRKRCPGPGNMCRCSCFAMHQILTLRGPTSSYEWRKVPYPRPMVKLDMHTFCFNGFLFWMNMAKKPSGKSRSLPLFVARGFSLEYEAFWSGFSCEGLSDSHELFVRSKILQCGAQLALLDCHSSRKRMHIYRYAHSNETPSSCRFHKNTIGHLPPDLLGKSLHDVIPVGNLPNGDVLLANDRADEFCTPVYSYNYETMSFNSFVVGKFPPLAASMSPTEMAICITCVEENLTPLGCLLGAT